MGYSVILNDKEYDLPKKTLAIARLFDSARAVTETARSYEKQYELVIACLGKEAAAEVLDGNKLDEADLSALSIAFLEIEQAYLEPVEEVRAKHEYGKTENAVFDKITELGNSVEKINRIVEKAKK